MFSVISTRALKVKMSAHSRRYLGVGVLVVLIALALVIARAAFATTIYAYYDEFANPGVPHSSAGWNYREHNRACRDDAIYTAMASCAPGTTTARAIWSTTPVMY
jgi:hypothetical protein